LSLKYKLELVPMEKALLPHFHTPLLSSTQESFTFYNSFSVEKEKRKDERKKMEWSSVSAIKLGSFVLPPSPRGCVFVAQI
jgi:hypothetical protein